MNSEDSDVCMFSKSSQGSPICSAKIASSDNSGDAVMGSLCQAASLPSPLAMGSYHLPTRTCLLSYMALQGLQDSLLAFF